MTGRPSNRRAAPWHIDAAVALALALITTALYWPAREFGFIPYDDPVYVAANPTVQAGLSATGVEWAFGIRASHWIPLTWLSLMLDSSLFGPGPAGFHRTNLLLHAFDAALLFAALRRLGMERWPAIATAALFAVHPTQVESVAWVTERKDVLSTAFWFATLWAWAGYVQRPTRARYGSVFLCATLGLLAKPMLVSLPLVLLLLDLWPLRRWPSKPIRTLLVEKLPLLGLAVVASVITYVAQSHGGAVLESLPLSLRLANAILSVPRYLASLFWPRSLAVFYPYDAAPSPWLVAAAAVFLLALSVGAVAQSRVRPWITAGWGWFIVTLAPVLGVVQVGEQSMADRFTYVPMIGLAWIVAQMGAEVAGRGSASARAVAATMVALLLSLTIVTRAQLAHWRDGVTLFSHAVEVTRDNYMAHWLLGTALNDSGMRIEALTQLEEAARLRPGYAPIRVNLGNSLLRAGRADDAVPHYRAALAARPGWAVAHNSLGYALWLRGDVPGAVAEYRAAVAADPDYAEAHFNLAEALEHQGDLAAALTHLAVVLRLRPSSRDARQAYERVAVRQRGGPPPAAGP